MAKKLTTIAVANAKPGSTRREIPDGGCAGLYLLVQPGGKKSWAVRYRLKGRPAKLTLGPVEAVTLADARARTTAALKAVGAGTDPAADKRRDKADDKASGADTVEALAAQFVKHCEARGNRTWARTKACLDNEVLPRWRGKTVHDVTQDDVERLIDAIAADRPIAANRALAAVRRWFTWMGGKYKGGKKAILKSRLRTFPCLGIEAPGKEKKRPRVLSADEIRAAWAACEEIGEPFGPFVRLLLLTGARRSEGAGLRRSEIGETAWTDDDKKVHVADIWSLPEARTKNKLEHIVPLASQAKALINRVTPIAGDFVFTTTGKSALSGFSRAKRRIDKLMIRRLREVYGQRGDGVRLAYLDRVEDLMRRIAAAKGKEVRKELSKELNAIWWILHDLRRTLSTGMAEIRILPHVIDAVTNHVSGEAKKDVSGTYNRWSYFPEKTVALQRWADRIEELVIVADDKAAAA